MNPISQSLGCFSLEAVAWSPSHHRSESRGCALNSSAQGESHLVERQRRDANSWRMAHRGDYKQRSNGFVSVTCFISGAHWGQKSRSACCAVCLPSGQAHVPETETATGAAQPCQGWLAPSRALRGPRRGAHLLQRSPSARHSPRLSRSCVQHPCTAIPGPAWEILLIG